MEDILIMLEKNITSCEDDLNRLKRIKQHIGSVRERFHEDLESGSLMQRLAGKPKAEIKPETFISHENLISRLLDEDIVISNGEYKAWVKNGIAYLSSPLEVEDNLYNYMVCFHAFNEWFITPPEELE